MGQRVRRQVRVELTGRLGELDEAGQPVRALADVVAHRGGYVLVAAGGDKRLDDQVSVLVARFEEALADAEQYLDDGSLWVGGEHLGEQSPPVRVQRLDQQLCLRREVRVQGAVGHPGRGRDVGDTGAVVAALGEYLGGGLQQALAGLRSGDSGDPTHVGIK